jgi:hypothetical protein
MQNIVINYKILNDIDDNLLLSIVNGCNSKKYKVFLNLYDFSLSKRIESQLSQIKSLIEIEILTRDYEERENADNIVLQNLIQHGDSIAFASISDNVVLNPYSIDELGLEWLKEESSGFIYTDYNINDIKCFMRSRAMNVSLNIPVVFWSTSKLVKHFTDQDKLQIVGNNYASIHIPKSLCTIYQYE